MKFVVYFYSDREVLELPDTDIITEDNWNFEDWKRSGEQEVRVKAYYNDEVYEACVLQVSIKAI